MTPVVLLEQLKQFTERNIEDIALYTRPEKAGGKPGRRAAEVHIMRLPDEEAEKKRIPYIVWQFLTGKDDQPPGEKPESECKIRGVIAVYSENDSEGAMDVLNVITRIRIALLKSGEIGQQFLLKKPLEYIVYPDDTRPYFLGEIMLVFEMPEIHREIF